MNLVFENRFRGYGAYELRQKYAKIKVMAMGFTLLLLGLIFTGPMLFAKDTPPKLSHTPIPPDTTIYCFVPIDPPPQEQEQTKSGGGSGTDGQPDFDPSAPNLPLPPLVPVDGKPGKFIGGGDGTDNLPKDPIDEFEPDKPGKGTLPEKPDVPCEPYGGIEAFTQYIQDNFNPEASCDDLMEGYAQVRFTVGEDGRISQVSLVESTRSCPQFAQEVMRIIAASPKWKAAQLRGSFVKCYRIVPVKLSFRENAP